MGPDLIDKATITIGTVGLLLMLCYGLGSWFARKGAEIRAFSSMYKPLPKAKPKKKAQNKSGKRGK